LIKPSDELPSQEKKYYVNPTVVLPAAEFCLSIPAAADLFLVTSSEGPGFATPEEADNVLEKGILPAFDMLMELKAKKKMWLAAFRPARPCSI
jgi:hypothetical protein